MELMNRIRERVVAWQKKRVRTVVFPLTGKLCAVETVEGKRLGQWQADYDGDTPNLKECFLSLKAAGLRGKKLWLLVNAESLRWSRKRYPQMTEEEFAESMEWEADRVFHTEEAIAMGHRVLSHDEEGWEALLHALPRVNLGAWEMGAHEAGLTITRAFPVTDIPLQEGPHFILYMRRRSAMLLFRRGDLWESRILHLADEGKASLFMERQMDLYGLSSLPCFLVPLESCGTKERTAWLSYMEKELTLLAAEGTEDEGSKAVTLETEHLEEGGYWDDAMRVVLAVSHAGTALPLLMGERPFLTEENRKLRIAQGACALGAAFFLFSCASFLSAYRADKAQLAENEALSPLKVKRAEMKKASEEEEALLAMLKEAEAKDPHWEQRLVLLADGMPQGVVLSEISAEGEDVLLKGTSQKASDLSNFTGHLTRAWGGLTELKSRKKNARTGLFEFTVRWKKETTRKSP